MPGLMLDRDDTCFYVTEKCNSNCFMCPMSLDSRKRGEQMSDEEWDRFEELIPSDVSHITITGGEPFLLHGQLLPALEKLNRLYPNTDILILTNGRALALPEIMEPLRPLITDRYCFAVPIHGPDAALHDAVTASPGSFRQSLIGLHNLSSTAAKIEVRIVGHRLNLDRISETYRMLCGLGARIDIINLIAMEMTGCAARNRDKLWVDYRILCEKAEEGIRYAVLHGINTGLYNFPLCQVPERMWPLIKLSITPSKVMYAEACEGCAQREACGGMFYSTRLLGLCAVKPFGKGE
jgi:His-Xaa-Ser system radical SAM maturase HxsC